MEYKTKLIHDINEVITDNRNKLTKRSLETLITIREELKREESPEGIIKWLAELIKLLRGK